MNVDDAVLDRVREYRRAARMAVEADVPFETKALALLDVADMARKEPDPVVSRWAELAIWAESEMFLLGRDPVKEAGIGDAWERAQGAMRAEGYDACPRCRSRIASTEELENLHLRRLRRIDELERRQGAVDR